MSFLPDSQTLGTSLQDRVIDNETGIIRWISEIPLEPGEPEIFNYSAKMCDSSKFFPIGCYDSNGGAGLSRTAAYRAAMGEAIERYSSSVFFPDQLILGTYKEVKNNARALRPEEVALFHEQDRDKIKYTWFTEDTPLCWATGYSLSSKELMLIPACLVYVPYYPFLRQKGEQTIAPSVSTGQASSFSPQGAILNGIYEIVERDAFMISWLNRLPLAKLDINSSAKVSRVFNEKFNRKGLQYHLFQMATDIGIPSVLCIVIDYNRDPPMICCGGAANLDAETAALKALVEAVQTRQWAIFMGKKNEPVVLENDYSDIDDFEKHVFLYAYGDMLPAIDFLLKSENTKAFSSFKSRATNNIKADLKYAMQLVEERDYEIIVVDQTTVDVHECGYYVVKVLVPKLQPLEGDHYHRFLGGTRLYEVPAKLGYNIDSRYETLNPYPHPYP